MLLLSVLFFFFFFIDTATTEIYTLSLHDALPISRCRGPGPLGRLPSEGRSPSRSCKFLCSSIRTTRPAPERSEEHTSELQSHSDLVCRLLLEKKKKTKIKRHNTRIRHRNTESQGT